MHATISAPPGTTEHMALLYAGNPHEVMHVISMRHVLRTAGWPVDVCVPMGTAIMYRRASVRVISSGGDPMVTHVVATHVVQMPS